jgi:hypothetical protein
MSAVGRGGDSDGEKSDDERRQSDSSDDTLQEDVTVASLADRLRKALLEAHNARMECETVPEATRQMIVDCFSLGVSASNQLLIRTCYSL